MEEQEIKIEYLMEFEVNRVWYPFGLPQPQFDYAFNELAQEFRKGDNWERRVRIIKKTWFLADQSITVYR